jgi:putative DNA primase/helicase
MDTVPGNDHFGNGTGKNDTLTRVLGYHARGWSVFPLKDKRNPHVSWKDAQTTRPSAELLRQWWTKWPDAWVGLALGEVSQTVRIDMDGVVPASELPPLPETAEFVTPSGGRGWLLQWCVGLETEVIWRGTQPHQELRLQSGGAYTVIPGSPASPGYRWVRDTPVARVPLWLEARADARLLAALEREINPEQRPPVGVADALAALKHISSDPYDIWIGVGMALRTLGAEMLPHWVEWSRTSEKFVPGECERKWESFDDLPGGYTARSLFHWAYQSDGWRPPDWCEPLTPVGSSRVLARKSREDHRHSEAWGWLHYEEGRWVRTREAIVEAQKCLLEEKRKGVAREIHKATVADPPDEARQKVLKPVLVAIKRLETQVDMTVRLAGPDPAVKCKYKDFDRQPWLFNFANGTFDFLADEFRDHRREDLLTQMCPHPWNPRAECPLWEKFLADILPDPEVREFVRLYLGCCLTGDTSVQMLPVFWGSGGNGKTTLVETVFHVLGADYSMKGKKDLLIQKTTSDHPTSLARLHGKRFVACVESGQGSKLDETLVKELTGSDTISARFMRQDEWQFETTHKIVLATNNKPEIHGMDPAIWRRVALVPFLVEFLPGDPKRDGKMGDKLKLEAVGILNWFVRACQDWLKADKVIERPPEVERATNLYRHEENKLAEFIQEYFETGQGFHLPSSEVTRLYKEWCYREREISMDKRAFGDAMKAMGFDRNRSDKHYYGLRLRTQGEPL